MLLLIKCISNMLYLYVNVLAIHYSNIYTDTVFTTNLFLYILNSSELGELLDVMNSQENAISLK